MISPNAGIPTAPVVSETGWTVTVDDHVYAFVDQPTALAFATVVNATYVAAAEWFQGVKQMLRQYEALLAEGDRLRRLYAQNSLVHLVLATPQDGIVPGMGVSWLRSIAVGTLFQNLDAFLAENAVVDPAMGTIPLPTRENIIYTRD